MLEEPWSRRALFMSNTDGTTPPVLFVVQYCWSRKSSLVTAFQRWARFLEIDALTINLDPGLSAFTMTPNSMLEI